MGNSLAWSKDAKRTTTTKLTALGGSTRALATPSSPLDNPEQCLTSYKSSSGNHWDIVGQTYNDSSSDNNRFYFEDGSTSTLGIGVSLSDDYGTWSASGSQTSSKSYAIGFPEQLGAHGEYFKTEFHEGYYSTHCVWTGGSSTTYSYRNNGFSGGAASSGASIPSAGYCTGVEDKADIHIHTSQAITWSNGLDTSASLGISLNTDTGYSTDAELAYYFHHNGYLCGTNNFAGSSYQVVAK